MRRATAWRLVAIGYVGAVVLACGAVGLSLAFTSNPRAQNSSGMYAFGDAVLFVTVFGVSALVPTIVALFILRAYPRFWTVLATAGFALSLTGVTGAFLFAVGRHAVGSTLASWAGVSVLRILVSPPLALAFVMAALTAPSRVPRLALLSAAALEAAVSAYGAFVWFVPLLPR